MATWAAKLASANETPEDQPTARPEKDQTVAVLDANAIISLGAQARTLADILVTTEEIIAEIRDASSRASVDMLSIIRRAPSDEAVRAVAGFASRTGDLHQLSAEDVRLLALAYTYEVERFGTSHLRTVPVSIKAHCRRTAAAQMPGWGTNSNNEEWEAIDEIEDQGTIFLCYQLSV